MQLHLLRTGLLLGLATTALAGSVASAADTDGGAEPYLAAPGEPLAPGQELQLQGYCPDPETGPLTSEVLSNVQILPDPQSGPPNLNASDVVTDEARLSPPVLHAVMLVLNPDEHQPWGIGGTTTVTQGAAPDDHPVWALCSEGPVRPPSRCRQAPATTAVRVAPAMTRSPASHRGPRCRVTSVTSPPPSRRCG